MSKTTALQTIARELQCTPEEFMKVREDGNNLVVIAPTGQKFIYTPQDVAALQAQHAAEDEAAKEAAKATKKDK